MCSTLFRRARGVIGVALLLLPGGALAQSVTSQDVTLSATPVIVVPLVAVRIAWSIVNLSGTDALCTDDNTTPSSTHATFRVYAGGQADSGGRPANAWPIQCIGSGAVTGEWW